MASSRQMDYRRAEHQASLQAGVSDEAMAFRKAYEDILDGVVSSNDPLDLQEAACGLNELLKSERVPSNTAFEREYQDLSYHLYRVADSLVELGWSQECDTDDVRARLVDFVEALSGYELWDHLDYFGNAMREELDMEGTSQARINFVSFTARLIARDLFWGLNFPLAIVREYIPHAGVKTYNHLRTLECDLPRLDAKTKELSERLYRGTCH